MPDDQHSTDEGTTVRADGTAWDPDVIRSSMLWWFRPILDPTSWMALAYLFVGVATSAVFFVLVHAAGWTAVSLCFAVVGVYLVVPAFGLAQSLTGVEAAMAGWAGESVTVRSPASVRGIGIRGARDAVADPLRWRHIGFHSANVLIAPVLFVAGALPLLLALEVAIGLVPWLDVDLGPAGVILRLPVAAALLGLAPRSGRWAAARKAEVAAWFVGPDRLAAAEARVVDLAGQRQQILDAVALERRRIERNLHDGVQQQLVAIGIDLAMAQEHLVDDPERARELLAHAGAKVRGSIGELRQLGRGLHPSILADRGLDAALSAVVADAPLPISVQVDPGLRLDTDVAETVYFVVNEAVANVFKHARARAASVRVARVGANVRVTVHDDGVGGIDASRGTGLAGIEARVRGCDGEVSIASPPGGPTTVVAELPCRSPHAVDRGGEPDA